MRSQDLPSSYYPEKSDRLYTDEERWYFRVRDGEEVGPFRYRSEAQSNLERYLQELKNKL